MEKKCTECEYTREVTAQDIFKFIGCYHKPYKGKWIVEIRNCPRNDKNNSED